MVESASDMWPTGAVDPVMLGDRSVALHILRQLAPPFIESSPSIVLPKLIVRAGLVTDRCCNEQQSVLGAFRVNAAAQTY